MKSNVDSEQATVRKCAMENGAMVLDVPQVVALDDLAARIRTEHTAVGTALKESLEHAMAAGDLLIDAKGKVAHGEWLPWLRDRCQMSERTAQLYMRVAKNRREIEDEQKRNGVADLSLNEAAALLVLSSDLRKLLNFAKEIEGIYDPEQLVKVCVENDVGVIRDSGYDPFAGRSAREQREWIAFMTFMVRDCGYSAEGAGGLVEWILQRPFQNVSEWLGEEGDQFRRYNCYNIIKPIPDETIASWHTFMSERDAYSQSDFEQEAMRIEEQRRKDEAGRGEKARTRRSRRRAA
jgi:hypothetical protein